MRKTEEKVDELIRETGMLADGDRVIAGVSGGADSVFLFYTLLRLAPKLHLRLSVLHVHHGIRGAEADRDAGFVRALCAAHGVPFRLARRDVPAEAKAQGLTLEEAGRRARYELLFGEAIRAAGAGAPDCPDREKPDAGTAPACPEPGAASSGSSPAGSVPEDRCVCGSGSAELPVPLGRVRIALAHQMNDAAENVLLQMARGCGPAGIGSLRPVRPFSGERPELLVIRPLLCLTREEIVSALQAEGRRWCEDSTNGEKEAVRNRIRLDILPLLSSEVNAQAVRHLAGAAEAAAEAADFVRASAAARADRYLEEKPEGLLVREAFTCEMPAVRTELLRTALARVTPGGEAKDIGRAHLEGMAALMRKQNGARMDLPRTVRAVRVQEGLLLTAGTTDGGRHGAASYLSRPLSDAVCEGAGITLPLPAEHGAVTCLHAGGLVLTAALTEAPPAPVPEMQYTKWIDYDKINGHLTVRTRRPGDFLTVGDGMRKSLSDYFTNEKVPRAVRDRILLIADGSEIVWVIGWRIGYRYRIGPSAGRALKVEAAEERNERGDLSYRTDDIQ